MAEVVVELSERLVLITGASRGIGRAIALALAPCRPHLLLVATDRARLEAVAEEARGLEAQVEIHATDLRDPGVPEALAGRVGARPVAGLVHAAGTVALGSVEATSAADLDRNWAVNLRAPYLLTSRLLPALRRARGHVVFISSGAGQVAKAGWSAYAASKHGLRALADSLRAEEAEVRVTSIYPGRTATDMQAAVHEHEGRPYDPSAFVRPEDVARVTLTALTTAPPAVVEEIDIRPT